MCNASPWPEPATGALSLSFDDGCQSQIDIALPILEEHRLLGTFYVNPGGDSWLERSAQWREAALHGHEIGNHTVRHVCSRNLFGDSAAKSLETSTVDDIDADVAEADRQLRELIPEQRQRTFCYPCYQSDVGVGARRRSYVPAIARRFPAARARGEGGNDPAHVDLHYLSSWPVAGWMQGKQLCSFAEYAATKRKWGILTFHEFAESTSPWVPGRADHTPPLPAAAFRTLCEYLEKETPRLWTAPVLTVAKRVIGWRGSNDD